MAFKKISGELRAPDDPEVLFRDLRGRKIQGLLSQQADVLREYARVGVGLDDVAIQLPTGSGKTLVGLLIAEWRRRKFGERVLYLCPTRQLVNQVVANATAKYGLKLNGFTGSRRDFDPARSSEYVSAEAVGVATYSAIFNSNPFFEDPQVLVCDDAHAAESYIASMWSLQILRRTHETLYVNVLSALKDTLETTDYQRLRSEDPTHWDEQWIELIPGPKLDAVVPTLEGLLDAHCTDDVHRYAWSELKGHLAACNLFVTPRELLIRPLVPPTFQHSPFAGAAQRVYMSATLGAGGDLERIMGRRAIQRINPPAGFERQGVGRRFFLFPGRSLEPDAANAMVRELIDEAPRTLYLVPSDARAAEVRDSLATLADLHFFDGRGLENSKASFVSANRAIALVANRYDGIDLNGDECRLLIFDGFPGTTNLQEKFLVTRMAAGVILDERVGTRLAQGFGRCTRSDTDYAVVVVVGESISKHLLKAERRAHFHPELQAEIEFGLEQSKDVAGSEMLANTKTFLAQGEEWRSAEYQLLGIRDARTREPRAGETDLATAVGHEVEYSEKLWNGDHQGALASAESVLGFLNADPLRGYRALWNYLAGCCAWRLGSNDSDGFRGRAREWFRRAAAAATGVRWLHEVARMTAVEVLETDTTQQALMEQVACVEAQLERLGIVNNRGFEAELLGVTIGLGGGATPAFERAHALLGKNLGFESGCESGPAEPDAWWRVSANEYIVFEDHADALQTSSISVKKVRQAASHEAWLRTRRGLPDSAKVVVVMISPCCEVDREAQPLGREVGLWALADFRAWAQRGLECIRGLRSSYPGRLDLAWQADAAERLKQSGCDPQSILARVTRVKIEDLRARG
ncbi:MAG: DEAD/DEAH box helicase [Candidatus Eisenbacteria bacterium]|nr:DEAD/DEAH box helicase [Candidatus Eisenbacteria bacterium]